jgi:glycosyltransferase involved in cell wall biosynthesis
VVVQAGPTNSQWNEHCLPVADVRRLTVCSLFPATVEPDDRITQLEGDGSVWGALRVLRRALREPGLDVVHVHAPASVPLVLVASALERRSLRDVMFTLHTCWPNIRPRNRPLAAAAFFAFPVVVACSRSTAESVPAAVRRLARWDAQVVQNGVDVKRVDRDLATASADAHAPGPGRTVLTVGRLIPQKDQATLLAAFARIAGRDDRLVVIGEGPLHAELAAEAERLGIADRVQMTGLMPRDEVYRRLGGADYFVSPSRGEGLPLSVLEAMTAGLPTVLSDIAPHREIVEDTDVAELVPVGDADALATAMARLHRMSAAERRAAGARGRELVEGHFNLDAMADGYHRVYTRLSDRTAALNRETA